MLIMEFMKFYSSVFDVRNGAMLMPEEEPQEMIDEVGLGVYRADDIPVSNGASQSDQDRDSLCAHGSFPRQSAVYECFGIIWTAGPWWFNIVCRFTCLSPSVQPLCVPHVIVARFSSAAALLSVSQSRYGEDDMTAASV